MFQHKAYLFFVFLIIILIWLEVDINKLYGQTKAKDNNIGSFIKDLLDPLKRDEAQKQLIIIGSPATPALMELIQDKSVPEEVRCTAIHVIGEIRDKIATSFLVKLVSDPSEGAIGLYAVQALGDLKDSASVPFLVSLLSDKKLRSAAATSLGQIGDKNATLPLMTSLSLRDVDYTKDAILALGKIKDQRAVPALIPLVSSNEETISSAAEEALGEIGDPQGTKAVLAVLNPANAVVYCRQLSVLGKLRDPQCLPTLVKALDDDRVLPKKTAIKAIGELGIEDGVFPLLSVIKSNSEEFTPLAITTMGKIEHKKAAEALFEIGFSNKDSFFSWLAKNSLSQMDCATSFLIEKLKDTDTREKALEILERVGKPAVSQLLAQLEYKELAPSVIQVLGKIGDSSVVLSLIPLLSSKEFAIHAVIALKEIGDKRAVPALIDLVKEGKADTEVQVETIYALGKIGDREATSVLREILKREESNSEIKKSCIVALGRLSDQEAIPLIIPLLSEDAPHRLEVISTLGETKAVKSIPGLIQIIAEGKEPYFQAALDAISKINSKEADAGLKKLITGKERLKDIAIATTLASLGDMEVFDVIRLGAMDSDPETRKKAISELWKIKDKRSVDILIDALQDKDRFIKIKVRECLRILTEKDFGDEISPWKEWWGKNRESFKFTTSNE